MEISGEATVIGRRMHGENAVILDLLSRDHGRVAGLLPGGASPRRAAMTQPGSRVSFRHRARREDQLGTLSIEPVAARAGVLADPAALAGLNAVCALLCWALPERDPHPRFTDATEALLDAIEGGAGWPSDYWPRDYLRWEMALLHELGFGLDLSVCAATGRQAGLAFVSPRSGRAVSREGAGDWAPRLLVLPDFLGGEGGGLTEGFALTGHFIETRLAAHVGKPLPAARARLAARLMSGRAAPSTAPPPPASVPDPG